MYLRNLLLIIATAILFTFLFLYEKIGLNLVIFETLIVSFLILQYKPDFKNKLFLTLLGSTVFTAFLVLYIHTSFAIMMNMLSILLLKSLVLYPKMRSVFNAGGMIMEHIALTGLNIARTFSGAATQRKRVRVAFRYARLTVIPLIVIFMFTTLYAVASPFFGDTLSEGWNLFSGWFDGLTWTSTWVFILGLFIAGVLLLQKTYTYFEKQDTLPELLQRVRPTIKRKRFKILALKNEYRSGIFLFAGLNLLISIVNILDVKHVWFGFEWEGGYLKQFVHAGTYLLLFCILISAAITLYYFRKNQNFYQSNKWLKYLAYFWLFQNAVMVISVGIRNYHYIEHFALAYKRIGVVIFLVLTLYGLYSVARKIQTRKRGNYLFRVNAMATLLVLVVASAVNWDVWIAQYNLKNYETSFVHYEFLQTLDDKALPYMDLTHKQIAAIKAAQAKKFYFDHYYIEGEAFKSRMLRRQAEFMVDYQHRSVLSWNYADQKTYELLNAKLE